MRLAAARDEMSSVGATVVKGDKLIDTKGYSTSMAMSTLNHLLVTKYLRKGDGIIHHRDACFAQSGAPLRRDWHGCRSSRRRAGAKSVEI